MKKAANEARYPLLCSKRKLRKLALAATEPLMLYGTYDDQLKFQAMVAPGLFLELLDYWLLNAGKKYDWRKKGEQ